jgi:hypothetical protein
MVIGMSIGPVLAAIYLQSRQVFMKTIISGRGYSSDAYNLVFMTAALLSVILIAFSVFLKWW